MENFFYITLTKEKMLTVYYNPTFSHTLVDDTR